VRFQKNQKLSTILEEEILHRKNLEELVKEQGLIINELQRAALQKNLPPIPPQPSQQSMTPRIHHPLPVLPQRSNSIVDIKRDDLVGITTDSLHQQQTKRSTQEHDVSESEDENCNSPGKSPRKITP